MVRPRIPAPMKNVDGVIYLHAGNTTIDKIERVLSCLTESNLSPLDIIVEKYDNRCCVYIKNEKWSLHHSSIINCTNGWGTPLDTPKTN